MNNLKFIIIAVIFLITAGSVNSQNVETDFTVYDYSTTIEEGKELEKNILLKDEENIIAQITLRDGKSLGMHSEAGAFWVFATAGSGDLIFENDRIVKLEPGKIVTVKPGIPHDVIAKSEVSIIVIKFLDEDGDEGVGNHEHNH